MEKQILESPLLIPLRPPPPPNVLFPHLWLNHGALATSKCTTTEHFPSPADITPNDQRFSQTLRMRPGDDCSPQAHTFRTLLRTPSPGLPIGVKVPTTNPAWDSRPKYAEDQVGKGRRQKIRRTESSLIPSNNIPPSDFSQQPASESKTIVAPDLLETITPRKRYSTEVEKAKFTLKGVARESGSEKSPESGADDFEEESDTRPSSASRGEQNIECVVCGDKSSGKHYGQHTCEGCKSFFKRSVRRKLVYKCRGNRQCPVDMHHRNQCQHCRFQKCLKTGMRKEAVQQGRLPSFGSQYYPGLFGLSLGGLMGSGSLMSSAPIQPNPSHTQLISQLLRAEPILHSELFRADLHDIKASLIQYITSPEESSELTKLRDPEGMEGTLVEERCARFLMHHADWARQTPFFASLCLQDQISLLKAAWPEIFLLSLAQVGPLGLLGFSVERPQPLSPAPRQTSTKHPNTSDPNSSAIRQDLGASREFSHHPQSRLCPVQELLGKATEGQKIPGNQQADRDHRKSQLRLLCESIGCIANLQLDAVECVCLKSLLLFNPDAPGLIDTFNIDCTQTKIQGAFEEYLRYQFPHQSPLRFGHILLRLHGLQRVGKEVYEELLLPTKMRRMSIDAFMEEVLRNEFPNLHSNQPFTKGMIPPVSLSDPRVASSRPLSVVEVGPSPLPIFAETGPIMTSLAQNPNCDSEQLGYMRSYLNPSPSITSRMGCSLSGQRRPFLFRPNRSSENLTKSSSPIRGNISTSRPILFNSSPERSDQRELLREHIQRIIDHNLPSTFSDFSTYLRSLTLDRDLTNFYRPCPSKTEDNSQQCYLTERCRMTNGPSNTLLPSGKLTSNRSTTVAYTHSVSSLINCGPSTPRAQMVSRTESKKP